MKLGLIVEGLADGGVCQVAANRLVPGITVHPPTTLVNKPRLLRECGEVAAALLNASTCDKVIILWDLFPNWPDEATKKAAKAKKGKEKKKPRIGPDCKVDRAAALASLKAAGLENDSRVSLICITRMMESWLIADGPAITSVLVPRYIAAARLQKINPPGKPERHADPKVWLKDTFDQANKATYLDRDHAPAILNAIGDLGVLKKVQSFKRYAEKLTGALGRHRRRKPEQEPPMHADAVPVVDLFKQELRLEVPLFQRQYVWTEDEQWAPLWEDISRKFTESILGRTNAPKHFLGAMVLDQKQTPATHVDKRQVIDGQQRLTTLQIFLAVMRDFCRANDCAELADRFASYTFNDLMSGAPKEDRYKVWPTKSDRGQFVDVMEAGSREALLEKHPIVRKKWKRTPEPRPAMVEAYFYFYGEIEEFFFGADGVPPVGESQPLKDRISACLLALKSALRVVEIDLDKEDDAQVIFETLNARGAPLLPADLLRNYIFLRAIREGLNSEELYKEYWEPFDDEFWRKEVRQGRLERPRSDLFMQHFLSSRRGEDTPIKHLFVEYRHWVETDKPFPTTTEELRTIARQGAHFRRVLAPVDGDPVAPLARFMESFDIRTAYPLMLVLLEAQLTPEQWRSVSTSLESYLLRRAVIGAPTKAYNRIFLNLSSSLRKSRVTPEALATGLAGLEGETSAWPSDDEFLEAWTNDDLYDRLTLAKLTHIFRRINDVSLSSKSEAIKFEGELTVEHLMPQNWIEHWPLEDGSRGVEDPAKLWSAGPKDPATELTLKRRALVQTIGNLTLLTQSLNSSVGNAGWTKRRPEVLKFSVLAINQQLSAFDKWDDSTIHHRASELFKSALKLWPGPPAI